MFMQKFIGKMQQFMNYRGNGENEKKKNKKKL